MSRFSRDSDERYRSIELTIHRTTDKAIQFDPEAGNDGWLPRSLISYSSDQEIGQIDSFPETLRVEVNSWVANKRGWKE